MVKFSSFYGNVKNEVFDQPKPWAYLWLNRVKCALCFPKIISILLHHHEEHTLKFQTKKF